MAIWELRRAAMNEFVSIVSRGCGDIDDEVFDPYGSPKDWKDRPLAGCAADKRKKQPVAGSFPLRRN